MVYSIYSITCFVLYHVPVRGGEGKALFSQAFAGWPYRDPGEFRNLPCPSDIQSHSFERVSSVYHTVDDGRSSSQG